MRQRQLRGVLVVLNLAIIASRSSGQAGGPPITTRDVEQADANRRTIYVTNNTNDTVTIIGVDFIRCENIRPTCGEHAVNIVIRPGKTEVVAYIDRIDRRLGWSWQYRIKTKSIPAPAAVQQQMQQQGARALINADGSRTTAVPIKAEDFRAVVDTFTTNATCGNLDSPNLPEGHRSLIMIFGTPAKPTARQVMILYNSSGIAYQYSDTRRDLGSDTLMTRLSLDLARESGIAGNTVGQKVEWFAMSGRIADAVALGRPSELAARIWKECGKP